MRINGKKMKNAVFYGGLEKEEYELIKDELVKRNRSVLRGLSLITVAYMLFMLLLSLRSAVSAANRTFFVMCLSASSVVAIVSWLGLLKNRVITMTGVYLYLASLFLYGIAIGCTQRTQTSVSILIFIMVGPLLFYDKSINMNCFILIFTAIFIYISMKIKEPLAAETDLINGITYGTMSCVINTRSLMMRIQRVWLKKKLEIMAEVDGLTGLRTRNSFEQRLGSYPKKAKRSVTCVYIDANGLHKLNNTQGHAAGDAMLQYLAEQTVLLFDREDVYRIGGDEFMVFCCDEDAAEIEKRVEKLSERMEQKQYSISPGIVSAAVKDLDMKDLIKHADANMYRAKQEYYARQGTDRRKNRGE